MAFVLQVGQVVQTVVWCQQGPQAGLSVFHHSVADVSGSPTDLQLAYYWDQVVGTGGLSIIVPPLITDSATYLGVAVTIVRPVNQITQYRSNPVAGTAGSDPMPFQISGLISKRTVLPGRHGRGRAYIPFVDQVDSAVDAQLYPSPTLDYIGRAYTYSTAMLTTHVGAIVGTGTVEIIPIVFNRVDYINSPAVSGTIVRPLWATQRRRSESGRPNVPPL